MSTFDTRPESLAQFSWVLGPVFGVDRIAGTDLALLDQGPGAVTIVNVPQRKFIACCPKLRHAVAFVARAAGVAS